MKLYMHPISTGARPVRLFIAENNISCEQVLVDMSIGAHRLPDYAALNPSMLLPLLVDDDFRLSESSAILKYLADKYDLPSYPKGLRERARVNEVMDWLNTQLYREFGYNLVYPQLFPHHKRRSDEAHAGCIEWGQAGASRWLQVLNDHWIGPDNAYLAGNTLTIADYYGSAIVTLGELVGCDFADSPNVRRWLGNMKQLKTWNAVNEMFEGFAAGNRGKQFARV